MTASGSPNAHWGFKKDETKPAMQCLNVPHEPHRLPSGQDCAGVPDPASQAGTSCLRCSCDWFAGNSGTCARPGCRHLRGDHNKPAAGSKPRQLRIVHRYQLDGTTLVIAVNERGTVGIGQAGLNPDDEKLQPVSLTELQQVIEQAIVDSHRIQRRLHPCDLRLQLREALAAGPKNLPELHAVPVPAYGTDIRAELARMSEDGEVRQTGTRWVLNRDC